MVLPLQGFWWQSGVNGIDYARKDDFQWISIIRLPDFVTEDDFKRAVDEAARKKKQDFSKVEFLMEESASSNIFLRKMHGFRSMWTDICILIVCGCPGPSKGMDIPPTCWRSASGTAGRRGRRGCVFWRLQKRNHSWPFKAIRFTSGEEALSD